MGGYEQKIYIHYWKLIIKTIKVKSYSRNQFQLFTKHQVVERLWGFFLFPSLENRYVDFHELCWEKVRNCELQELN